MLLIVYTIKTKIQVLDLQLALQLQLKRPWISASIHPRTVANTYDKW